MFLFTHFRVETGRQRHAGFTLLELLIVILLVAVLAGTVVGGGRHALERGRKARAQAELAAWSVALEDHRAACGDYPTALGLLKPEPAALSDPWGHPYRFAYKSQQPWTNPRYVLFSAGPDGLAGDALRAGGFADSAGSTDADNLYAFPP